MEKSKRGCPGKELGSLEENREKESHRRLEKKVFDEQSHQPCLTLRRAGLK